MKQKIRVFLEEKTPNHPGYFHGNIVVPNIINLYCTDEGTSDYNSRTVRRVIHSTSLNVLFINIFPTLYIIPLVIPILIIFSSFNDAFHLPILIP